MHLELSLQQSLADVAGCFQCARPASPLAAIGNPAAHTHMRIPSRPRPMFLPQKAMFKGYTAPALPKAAYVHGVDDKGHQGALARESRRIVLRCALLCQLRCASRLDPRLLEGRGPCRQPFGSRSGNCP